MPGHAETVSSASFITCDVAGVDIVGLGSGALRPTFTWSETASTIVVSAADVSFTNCRFVSNKLNVVTGFSVSGNGFGMYSCDGRDLSSILSFILFITIDDGADGLRFIGNNVTGIAVTNDSIIEMAGTHDDVVIKDNYLAYSAIQTATVALIHGNTTVTNIIVEGNSFSTISAASLSLVLDGTANTGIVRDNGFQNIATATAAQHKASCDVTGCVACENYFSSGVDFFALSPSTVGWTDDDVP